MSSTLYAQLADALRENASNREAIEQQDALILHQSDEITQLHAHVAEQADYIATLEQHLVEAQRDLADAESRCAFRTRVTAQAEAIQIQKERIEELEVEVRWLNNILEEQP